MLTSDFRVSLGATAERKDGQGDVQSCPPETLIPLYRRKNGAQMLASQPASLPGVRQPPVINRKRVPNRSAVPCASRLELRWSRLEGIALNMEGLICLICYHNSRSVEEKQKEPRET